MTHHHDQTWECRVCGEASEKVYRCTECGADMLAAEGGVSQ